MNHVTCKAPRLHGKSYTVLPRTPSFLSIKIECNRSLIVGGDLDLCKIWLSFRKQRSAGVLNTLRFERFNEITNNSYFNTQNSKAFFLQFSIYSEFLKLVRTNPLWNERAPC